MNKKIQEILNEIEKLEKRIEREIEQNESKVRYKIGKGKITFEKEIAELHKKLSGSLFRYITRASIFSILCAPIIYGMIIPGLLLDLSLCVYQGICFPIYGIPRVIRKNYMIFDRRYLKYLNLVEKINCEYCSYFNGLISYAAEIAGRTEQYWCPIKHASGKTKHHSRYNHFFEYGDAESYLSKLGEIRKKYDDLD